MNSSVGISFRILIPWLMVPINVMLSHNGHAIFLHMTSIPHCEWWTLALWVLFLQTHQTLALINWFLSISQVSPAMIKFSLPGFMLRYLEISFYYLLLINNYSWLIVRGNTWQKAWLLSLLIVKVLYLPLTSCWTPCEQRSCICFFLLFSALL